MIANEYIPPPYSYEVIQLFFKFLADILPLPVLRMGDFNNVFNIKQDRFPCPRNVNVECLTPLGKLCGEFGMHDLWRKLYLGKMHYSCYSKTRKTLSRIGMMLGSYEVFRYISSIDILPRGVSDHSPLLAIYVET